MAANRPILAGNRDILSQMYTRPQLADALECFRKSTVSRENWSAVGGTRRLNRRHTQRDAVHYLSAMGTIVRGDNTFWVKSPLSATAEFQGYNPEFRSIEHLQ